MTNDPIAATVTSSAPTTARPLGSARRDVIDLAAPGAVEMSSIVPVVILASSKVRSKLEAPPPRSQPIVARSETIWTILKHIEKRQTNLEHQKRYRRD
jgi:hypothetical protein